MRVAIPLFEGQVSEHFGHSEQFLFVDTDKELSKVLHKSVAAAPEHAPGVLPRWLAERGVDVVIAAGLGTRARDLLAASSIKVLTGVCGSDPDAVMTEFLKGQLKTAGNHCNHADHACNH